jgi:hypothetical protein
MFKTRASVLLAVTLFINVSSANGRVHRAFEKGASSVRESNEAYTDGRTETTNQQKLPLGACDYCINPCHQTERDKIRKSNEAKSFYVIDARPNFESAQQPCDGRKQVFDFKRHEKVTFYVINMNPFLFDYTVTKNEEIVPETAQNLFLKQFSGGGLFDFITASGGITKAAATAEAQDCEGDVRKIKAVLNYIDSNLSEWQKKYGQYNETYVSLRQAYTSLLDPMADCKGLCAGARDYQTSFASLPDKYTFEDLAISVLNGVEKLTNVSGKVANLEKTLEGLENAAAQIAEFDKRINTLAAAIAKDEANILTKNGEIVALEKKPKTPANEQALTKLKQELTALEAKRDRDAENKDIATESRDAIVKNSKTCDRASIEALSKRFDETRRKVDVLLDKVNIMCGNLFETSNKERLTGMNDAINVIFKHPELLLIQQFEVGGFDEPTKVTINVVRKARTVIAAPLPANTTGAPRPCKADAKPPTNNQAPKPEAEAKPIKEPKPEADQKPIKEPKPPSEVERQSVLETSSEPNRSTLPAAKAKLASVTPGFYIRPVSLVRSAYFKASEFNAGGPSSAHFSENAMSNSKDQLESQAGGGAPEAQPPQDTTTISKSGRFGIQSFSLSGGVVFSRLERQEFQTVLGIPRDRNGMPTKGDTLSNVIGLKENNNWTVGPLLMLNTLIAENKHVGLHGSFGITGKKAADTTDIDYFFGPSLNFLGRKLFFSTGVYIGKQVRLAGDAFIGAEVTKDQIIPVKKEFHARIGFSFTFRIFPY